MDWHKTSNQRLRCLRITAKEEKTVRAKLRVGTASLHVPLKQRAMAFVSSLFHMYA